MATTPTAATRRPAEYGTQVTRRLRARGLATLAGLLIALAGAGLATGFRGGAFLLVLLLVFAGVRVVDLRWLPELERRVRGNDGERHVGAILDGMAGAGWRVLHDVDLGRGNVDHVAIGPGGLLTIETKSHGGRLRIDRLDPRWLAQAYAQRKLLERLAGRKADCLLVFSRAYLDRAPARARGVLVLPARMLAGHLERRAVALAPAEVEALHGRLCAALDA